MDDSRVVTPPYLAGPLRLFPFTGLMLSPSRIGDPSSARAFARPYRDVSARLVSWEDKGFVRHDDSPAVYLHEYTSGGITIRGLVGALDISHRARRAAERVVFPHEGVHPGQADELADRMDEMKMHPAPILLVHRGPQQLRTLLAGVMAAPTYQDYTDRAGQRHRIWAIRDADTLAGLDASLAGSRAMIADGHHRYAAYLRLQHDHPGGPADHGLAMLVDQDDTPLFLGAIHRVLAGTTLQELETAAASIDARWRPCTAAEGIAALGPTTLVATDGEHWAILDIDVPRRRASIEVVHERLVPALATPPHRVTYHHSLDDALAHVSPGTGVALLLPALDFDLVLRVVAAGRLLPEKATSFQPKPSVGVLIRSLSDG
ncbi:DUF1015 family protein [Nocardioides sp. LS1]|uniref:DUF1015 family protein n=1 Tax=Nocardioides sp. LS1 TaxID=1027620 RepID=UPI000F617036|nr:DUF1015 family protein [Nocardioides sp. LS1]GCD88906.1 hypothetical protein NLS1_09120 [Nocardioides sp. LS1]